MSKLMCIHLTLQALLFLHSYSTGFSLAHISKDEILPAPMQGRDPSTPLQGDKQANHVKGSHKLDMGAVLNVTTTAKKDVVTICQVGLVKTDM